MRKLVLGLLLALAVMAPSIAQAAPTPAQLCESAIELASAKYAQCRLTAESKYSKTADAAKRSAALGKCSQRLSDAFLKASIRYGASCAVTEPSTAFDEYLKQCSDDAAAGAAGAALPDYVGDLATCNADLTTCDGNLTMCTGDLGTCSGDLATCTTDLATTAGDLATCEDDLAACGALPPAQLLKTGQTTSYGAGTDGDLQKGVTQGYIDNGDGTITDTKTGLMWEKKSDDGSIHDKDNTYTWTATGTGATGTAFSVFVATLNAASGFAGYTDWRVPNRRELESLVNLGANNPAVFPAFNSGCTASCTVLSCSCTSILNHWSSSSGSYSASGAWLVNFDGGLVEFDGKTMSNCVRAVRGGV